MLRYKSIDTPMDSKTKLEAKENGALVEKGKYQRLVGKLIYLSQIRPNISFSISVVSQFMNNPTKEHIKVVHRILRCLKMTSRKGLYFKKPSSKDIEIFTDVDWVKYRRSTSRYCTYVRGNLVTWQSKK